MADDDFAFANRMIEDVLQRQQGGAAFKLYTNRIISSGTVDETKSRSIAMDAILTNASMTIDPDNAHPVSISFRPASTPTFEFLTTA